ncbi:MAG: hypothetical protein Q7U98_18865 [Methylicorpusculum sp.]|uniref:hypothetical protein n=1 Tax=Methylicorpusculum sp. TaxID=2713644 RepID=UPI002719B309|nr:hypothetical protein [Methylicorpusculum sp.]MDO8844935.1 hypothetical protein [Methylicorpusculum sp.]MDO8941221.1 hypothetical protein [Methylicorpusculum sp.]MDO9240779.1 hypothetical protein [Methylicorpusculum sp.]MDP2203868.1 hypothetical protein [Methylicorpusculum sp.]
MIKDPVYLIEIVEEKPGAVTTLTGLQVVANRAFGDICDGIDTLMIPGSVDMQQVVLDNIALFLTGHFNVETTAIINSWVSAHPLQF